MFSPLKQFYWRQRIVDRCWWCIGEVKPLFLASCTFLVLFPVFIFKKTWPFVYLFLFVVCNLVSMNQACAWFIEILLRKVCVCTYLPIFVCPYKSTHVSKFFVCPYKPTHVSKLLSGKYSLYAWNKAKRILKLASTLVSFGSKVGFFQAEKWGVATRHRLRVWLSSWTFLVLYHWKTS